MSAPNKEKMEKMEKTPRGVKTLALFFLNGKYICTNECRKCPPGCKKCPPDCGFRNWARVLCKKCMNRNSARFTLFCVTVKDDQEVVERGIHHPEHFCADCAKNVKLQPKTFHPYAEWVDEDGFLEGGGGEWSYHVLVRHKDALVEAQKIFTSRREKATAMRQALNPCRFYPNLQFGDKCKFSHRFCTEGCGAPVSFTGSACHACDSKKPTVAPAPAPAPSSEEKSSTPVVVSKKYCCRPKCEGVEEQYLKHCTLCDSRMCYMCHKAHKHDWPKGQLKAVPKW